MLAHVCELEETLLAAKEQLGIMHEVAHSVTAQAELRKNNDAGAHVLGIRPQGFYLLEVTGNVGHSRVGDGGADSYVLSVHGPLPKAVSPD